MWDFFKHVFGWITQPRAWLLVLLFTAVFLFVPASWFAKTDIVVPPQWHLYIAIAFIFSAVALLSQGISTVGRRAAFRFQLWQAHRVTKDYLHHLTADEKRVLKEYTQ